jgi:uncharacterized protein YjiS (DUF1127 family)
MTNRGWDDETRAVLSKLETVEQIRAWFADPYVCHTDITKEAVRRLLSALDAERRTVQRLREDRDQAIDDAGLTELERALEDENLHTLAKRVRAVALALAKARANLSECDPVLRSSCDPLLTMTLGEGDRLPESTEPKETTG